MLATEVRTMDELFDEFRGHFDGKPNLISSIGYPAFTATFYGSDKAASLADAVRFTFFAGPGPADVLRDLIPHLTVRVDGEAYTCSEWGDKIDAGNTRLTPFPEGISTPTELRVEYANPFNGERGYNPPKHLGTATMDGRRLKIIRGDQDIGVPDFLLTVRRAHYVVETETPRFMRSMQALIPLLKD